MVRLGGANAGLAGLLKLGGVEVGAGIEPLAADLGAEASVLGDLYLAVSERRRLEFDYGGSNGCSTRMALPTGAGTGT